MDARRGRGSSSPAGAGEISSRGGRDAEPGDAVRRTDFGLTLVEMSGHEVRVRTRTRMKVGCALALAVETAVGPRTLNGRVQGCSVAGIDADGLTYDVTIGLDEQLSIPTAKRPAASRTDGAGSQGRADDAPPAIALVGNDPGDGPDLESIIEISEE